MLQGSTNRSGLKIPDSKISGNAIDSLPLVFIQKGRLYLIDTTHKVDFRSKLKPKYDIS